MESDPTELSSTAAGAIRSGKASGTFDYFTFAIVGTEASSRSDYTKSEDDMVIERGVAA